MNKTLLVALREYMENIRTKTFWIGIMAFPVILLLSIMVPIMLEKSKTARKYAIFDESGWLLEAVENQHATRDMTRILTETRFRARKQDGSISDLPPVLQSLAPTLKELEPEQMEKIASAIYEVEGEPDQEDVNAALSVSVVELVHRQRAGLKEWYAQLSEDGANAISSDLYRSQFVRITPGFNLEEGREKLNKMITEEMVKALCDIPCHLEMLNLVPAYRYLVCLEHQDIRRHQDRITEKTHGNGEIRILALLQIFLHGRLVCVGTVHQALCSNTGQKPGQFGNFRYIRLAIEHRPVGIQTQCQPRSRNFQC